jgi:hypothetical protein
LRTDRLACRPSFCAIGLLAQPEATRRSLCLAKSSIVTQSWKYLLVPFRQNAHRGLGRFNYRGLVY